MRIVRGVFVFSMRVSRDFIRYHEGEIAITSQKQCSMGPFLADIQKVFDSCQKTDKKLT